MRLGLILIVLLSSFLLSSCGAEDEMQGNVDETSVRTVEVTREITVERTVVAEEKDAEEAESPAPTPGGDMAQGDDTEQGGITGERLPGPAVPAEADVERNIGDTVTLDSGNTVAVLSGESGIPARDLLFEPREGMEFFVIEAEVCVPESATEPSYFTPREFSLQASDDVRRLASVPARLPALRGSSVEPGECSTGNITFQVDEDEEPQSVLFEGSSDVIWNLEEG